MKILQIIPVSIQTWAEYHSGMTVAVHAWALVEDQDGSRGVVGLCTGTSSNMLGLINMQDEDFNWYSQRGEEDLPPGILERVQSRLAWVDR